MSSWDNKSSSISMPVIFSSGKSSSQGIRERKRQRSVPQPTSRILLSPLSPKTLDKESWRKSSCTALRRCRKRGGSKIMTGSGVGEEGAELTSSIFLGLMFCDGCFVVLEEERVG